MKSTPLTLNQMRRRYNHEYYNVGNAETLRKLELILWKEFKVKVIAGPGNSIIFHNPRRTR